jgi:phage shock protein C
MGHPALKGHPRLELHNTPRRIILRGEDPMYCNACGTQMGEAEVRCPACGRTVPTFVVQKRLVRPRQGRKIAGVCAAFGNYFDIDPILIRLLWVVAVIFGGTGLLAYLLAWIVIPEEPQLLVEMRQP